MKIKKYGYFCLSLIMIIIIYFIYKDLSFKIAYKRALLEDYIQINPIEPYELSKCIIDTIIENTDNNEIEQIKMYVEKEKELKFSTKDTIKVIRRKYRLSATDSFNDKYKYSSYICRGGQTKTFAEYKKELDIKYDNLKLELN